MEIFSLFSIISFKKLSISFFGTFNKWTVKNITEKGIETTPVSYFLTETSLLSINVAISLWE